MDAWPDSLALAQYTANFRQNFFTSWERVSAVWDDELTSILEIERLGHRKRILKSLVDPEGGEEALAQRFGKVATTEVRAIEILTYISE